MHIAVIGSGVSGLAAAWLLSQKHKVDLFEKDDRLGGHANTQIIEVEGSEVAVDTGFIVYNERTYPNLTALYEHLQVETVATDMSFAVSARDGAQEYAGSSLTSLFARRSNLVSPSFLRMLWDIRRFYRDARIDANREPYRTYSLQKYLDEKGYGAAFCKDHLLPMGAAIWSMPARQMLAFPFFSFVRFCDNHGLLQIRDRPQWRTVVGGSKNYVVKMADGISGNIFLNSAVSSIMRKPGSVTLNMRSGNRRSYDHIVFACHSDQALRMLKAGDGEATDGEERVLSAIRYQKNVAVLHKDASLMPKRGAVWSAWNYMQAEQEDESRLCVSYWMNKLQPLETGTDLFITLNPVQQPRQGDVYRTYLYSHPIFDDAAVEAQKEIWDLQGHKRTWFCGAYLGHGFHEDGLQAGLEVAERLGGVERPWFVENPSGRLNFGDGGDYAGLEAAE